MSNIKFYTEEQVKQCLDDYFSFRDGAIYYALSKMTPIELPSDEKIEKVAEKTLSVNLIGFITGAKWMREQILNQNK